MSLGGFKNSSFGGKKEAKAKRDVMGIYKWWVKFEYLAGICTPSKSGIKYLRSFFL